MVLSAPSPDPPQGQDQPWFDEIARALRLVRRGVIILVAGACDARLRELVLGLLPEHPDLEVHTEAHRLRDCPERSLVVLVPRAEDVEWLNLVRPLFAERELRIILWATAEMSSTLATQARDFFDWISHRVECPPGVPAFTVSAIRRSLAMRAPGLIWTGTALDDAFQAALPGRTLLRLSASRPYSELYDCIRTAGRSWICFTDLVDRAHLFRARWALAEAGRRGRVVLDHPDMEEMESSGWFGPVHDRLMGIVEARSRLGKAGASSPGRLAVLATLEAALVKLVEEFLYSGIDPHALEEVFRASGQPELAILAIRGLGLPRRFDNPCFPGPDDQQLRDFVGRFELGARRVSILGAFQAASLHYALRPEPGSLGDHVHPREVEAALRLGDLLSPAHWEMLALAALALPDVDAAKRWACRARPSARNPLADIMAEVELAHRDYDAIVQALEGGGDAIAAERLLEKAVIRAHDEFTALPPDTGETNDPKLLRELQRRNLQIRLNKVQLQLAAVKLSSGKVQEARDLFLHVEAISAPDRTFQTDWWLLWVRAAIYRHEGYHAEAEAVLRTIIPSRGLLLHPDSVLAARALADSLARQGKYQEAEAEIMRALRDRNDPPSSWRAKLTGPLLLDLAGVLSAQGRYAEAEAAAKRALATIRSMPDPPPVELAQVLRRLAVVQAVTDKQQAAATAQAAIEALERAFGPDHPITQEARPTLERIASAAADSGEPATS